MQNLLNAWSNLEASRRLVVVLATVAVFTAVVFLARSASQKDLSLLFGGLDAAAAGEVITTLEQQGVAYDVRGAAIYVDKTRRDAIRMSLAAQGLPASGTAGYELLDELTGFGTTSQMFDAAYWRAREGELARTIQSSPAIRAARVHISTAANRPFERAQKPTASVTITTASGGLGATQIKALQYLVGSAVNGLNPADVAIIDDTDGLVSDTDNALADRAGDRADVLRTRAERLLSARVGPGNAVVEVSVDTVMQSEQFVERLVDPESRIAISTDVTETAATSSDSRGGNVTVASNLPDGDAAADPGNSANETSETRALTNFEVSQSERQVITEPGAVKRLTVAVLINELQSVAADGTITTTGRDPAELEDLQALVASAVGLNETRGDVITLRSLPFEPILAGEGTLVGNPGSPWNVMQLIQIGVLSAVALILGLFVVRPILSTRPGTAALPAPDAATFAEAELEEPMFPMALDGPADMGDFMGGDDFAASPDAVSRLRELIAERESETVQILQEWIEAPDNKESI